MIRYESQNIKKSWISLFNINKNKDIIENIYLKLNQELNQNIQFFPKYNDIFKCFTYFDINETKLVIVGQDPYYNEDKANGLCFGTNNIHLPPTLKNIINNIKKNTNENITDYSLESWAKQNVLLINSALTVVKNKPGSHMKLWKEFTDLIINELNNCDHSIIFVAWGAFAHKKLKNINTNKHHLLITSHPSPLSCYKKYKGYDSFNDSNIFSKINNILESNNDTKIHF